MLHLHARRTRGGGCRDHEKGELLATVSGVKTEELGISLDRPAGRPVYIPLLFLRGGVALAPGDKGIKMEGQ